MISLFRRTVAHAGAALFPGALAEPVERLSRLEAAGFSTRRGSGAPGAVWHLELSHPDLGAFEVVAPREPTAPPDALLDHASSLSSAEKAAVRRAGHALLVRSRAPRGAVLADRKALYRAGRALLADAGLAFFDDATQVYWSPAMLDDELSHDADLDVEAVFGLHAVSDEDGGGVAWLHSHGLAEIGAFDFDVLRPAPELTAGAYDGLRAVAFAIVEGNVTETTERFTLAPPGGEVGFVPARTFQATAPAESTRLRAGEGHDERRAVLCEPKGLLARLLRRPTTPSRFLSRPIPDDTIFAFSGAASELMADRARRTWGVCRRLAEEFEEMKPGVLVKIGYVADGGGPKDLEHLWFEVHHAGADSVDATLVNRPLFVSTLSEGERGRHALDRMSDWTVFLPTGSATPRNLRAAREARDRRDEILALLEKARLEGPPAT